VIVPRAPREQSVLVRTRRGACVRYVVRTSLGTLARSRPRARTPRPVVDRALADAARDAANTGAATDDA
jgi:hypothetical protein